MCHNTPVSLTPLVGLMMIQFVAIENGPKKNVNCNSQSAKLGDSICSR